jgi:GAF domain-containing protein
VRDITERKQAELLRIGQAQVLEMIATCKPLDEILESLIHLIESQLPGKMCVVMLLDEGGLHLRHGAAPNLPTAYARAVDGLAVGPNAGSCGTSIYRRQPVVVADIR